MAPGIAITDEKAIAVNAHNFVRVETAMYPGKRVKGGGLGRLVHDHEPTPIDSSRSCG